MSTPSLPDLDAIADVVNRLGSIETKLDELLAGRSGRTAATQLVDASTVARALGVSRSTVYEHAEQLGAVEVGKGDRPRLRFDVECARAAWTRRVSGEESDDSDPPVSTAPARRRRRAAGRSASGLLPVKREATT